MKVKRIKVRKVKKPKVRKVKKRKVYSVIYADPPWSIQSIAQVPAGRPGSLPYRAMRMVDIYRLPVSKLADDNCILFMWATSPLLPEAIYTVSAWGFEYKTIAFTWVKRNKKADSYFWGMGSWTRANAEFCLMGTKGKPKRESKGVHSIIDDRIMKHSKKPDEVRKRIVELCGDVPRIELFARERLEGWDAWGNEV